MRRDPLREQRIAEDPAGEGAYALEPALEWYAAYQEPSAKAPWLEPWG